MGHPYPPRTPRALALLGLLAACDGGSLGDHVVVVTGVLDEPVTVYLDCEACLAEVPVELYFDPEAFVAEDDEVSLEQYRVDYALPDLRGTVPYFADRLRQTVRKDDSVSVVLQVAGATQRSFVRQRAGQDGVEGEATITFAGYDSDDARVAIEDHFPIRFVFGQDPEAGEAAP